MKVIGMNKTVDIICDNELIELEKVDGEWVTKDEHWFGHTAEVDHNFKREHLIKILEKDFDEWSEDEDWWGGTKLWDVNVYHIYPNESACDYDGHMYSITVYGLKLSQGYLEVDTDTEIDKFYLYL